MYIYAFDKRVLVVLHDPRVKVFPNLLTCCTSYITLERFLYLNIHLYNTKRY